LVVKFLNDIGGGEECKDMSEIRESAMMSPKWHRVRQYFMS
jgi:hypothetical protein